MGTEVTGVAGIEGFMKEDQLVCCDDSEGVFMLWAPWSKIKPMMVHHLGVFGEVDEDFREGIDEAIRLLDSRASTLGIALDLSLGSLQALEESFGVLFYKDGRLIPELFYPLVYYVGEVVLRQVEGQWVPIVQDGFVEPWILLANGDHLNVAWLVCKKFARFPDCSQWSLYLNLVDDLKLP